MTIRVFLVDDHEIVRRGVADLLESTGEFEVVGEAGTAEQARNRFAQSNAELAILDVRLPDGNGIELCRDIRSTYPDVHCLILTSFSDDEAVVDAALAGAHGFALKQLRGNDILAAARAVARGDVLLDPARVKAAMARIARGADPDDRLSRLTDQERRVFDLIGEGKSNRQIGIELYVAEKTVKNYVSSVLAKLGMSRRTQAAALAARIDERSRRRVYE